MMIVIVHNEEEKGLLQLLLNLVESLARFPKELQTTRLRGRFQRHGIFVGLLFTLPHIILQYVLFCYVMCCYIILYYVIL